MLNGNPLFHSTFTIQHSTSPSFLLKTGAPDQLAVAWIRAQWIEYGADAKHHEPWMAILVRLLQPRECDVLFPECRVNLGDVECRHVPASGHLLESIEKTRRPHSIASTRVCVSET